MTEEIRSVCGSKEAAAFGPFCDWLERLYRLEVPSFIDRNYDSWLDIARPLSPIVDLVRMGGLRRLHSVVAGYFSDPRLQRLFSFQALYAGLSPFEALALYGVIDYMDTVEGVLFPRGGMHSVATGLARAAEKAGAVVELASGVERIVRRPGRDGAVTGVRLDGGEVVKADAVVCNVDLPVAYRQLLPELAMPRVARRGRYSPSCVVWLAGVAGGVAGGLTGGVAEGAAHHNIHFGQGWEDSFAALM
ncbi:MAG: phytoene desaturase, partial [Acidimicrobiales bacterium]